MVNGVGPERTKKKFTRAATRHTITPCRNARKSEGASISNKKKKKKKKKNIWRRGKKKGDQFKDGKGQN